MVQQLIEAERLGRSFGALMAVQEVSLTVAGGEVLALLGPNGAGKTTTMHMLAALLTPTCGSARIAGYDVRTSPAAVRARVGIMLDEPGFYGEMAVADYLLFFARLYGLRPSVVRPRLLALLERFGLADKQRAPLDTLSKGMRQKVALARTLLHQPCVLLLDEPTSALDPLSAQAVQQYIRERRAAGDAIIISTHNLTEAEGLADRVAIVARGRLRRQGTLTALRQVRDGATAWRVTLDAARRPYTDVLKGVDGVSGVELAASEPEGQSLRYETVTPRTTNPAAIAALSAAGAAVSALIPLQRTLNEVYLETMEEAERCA